MAEPVIYASPPTGDTVIEKYFDMSVIEIPLSQAFDAIGNTINGIETAGALMLARKHLHGL